MNYGVKQFGMAQMSSLVSTACDFLVTAAVFALTEHVVGSTAAGAVMGGAVNCAINYRWTFSGTTRTKRGVMWRYSLVWLGSVALNTTGTEWGVKLTHLLWAALGDGLGRSLTTVLAVKAVVALTTAVAWNFTMQKYYVYRKKQERCNIQ